MARIGDTREQIMDRANDLLLQRGYNGFSYRDIAEPMGVKNAAIHYHFPSKADLAAALVEMYHQELRDTTYRFMVHGGSARKQLEGLFAFTQRQYDQGRSLCPGGALSADFEELPDKVRDASRRLGEDTRAWLTRVLEIGREQDELTFEGDASARALLIIAALQGARQIARVSGDGVVGAVIDELRNELGMPAPDS